jgi:hypothetical protein
MNGGTRTTIQTPDDFGQLPSFRIADQKINNLVQRLNDKNLCGCCVARALMYRGADLAELMMGRAEAIKTLEYIISLIRENPLPSTSAH